MTLNSKLGRILLAIWLILAGLLSGLALGVGLLVLLQNIVMLMAGIIVLLLIRDQLADLPWSLGELLLGIWLIVSALLSLLNLGMGSLGVMLNVVAVAAGILLLLYREDHQVVRGLGGMLLAVWLLLSGLLALLGFDFPGSGIVLAALAVVAGILLLFDR